MAMDHQFLPLVVVTVVISHSLPLWYHVCSNEKLSPLTSQTNQLFSSILLNTYKIFRRY